MPDDWAQEPPCWLNTFGKYLSFELSTLAGKVPSRGFDGVHEAAAARMARTSSVSFGTS